MQKRVVVTGLGTVNPTGNSVPEYWQAILFGKSGIKKIDRFDVSSFSTQIAGLVEDVNFENVVDKKDLRRLSRFILLGVFAAEEAVKTSGLNIKNEADSIGVEVGSGIGGIEYLEEMALVLKEKGPHKISPFTVPMMIADMASGQIAIRHGAKGPNSCTVTACASSANAMGNAFRVIQRGDAVAMITGGAEAAVTPLGLGSFCAARALSARNDTPEKASRPFDKERDGFVMGEGAGILIFEELEHAKARGATIYGEIIGFGASGDAYHITAPAPNGTGAIQAIKMAMKDAGLKPEDVDYINAHGTSTPLNDLNETQAIKSAFNSHAYNLLISSTKSMTGHLLGAAGAVELICTALALKEGIVPPTINYDFPDPECDLNYVPNVAQKKNIKVALSNSFGFGGHNAVLAIRKY